jgi:hypothetical protein
MDTLARHGHRPWQCPRSHPRRGGPPRHRYPRGGRIARGFDADLATLDGGLEVAMTFVGGELAFRRPKGSAV